MMTMITITKLQRSLGIVHYCRFTADLSVVSARLSDLLGKPHRLMLGKPERLMLKNVYFATCFQVIP